MEFSTERLHIRPLTAGDWPSMQRIAGDFLRSEYAVYDMPLPTGEEEIRALTARFAASGLFFAVERRDSGEMIGYICFHEDGGSFDLGYCFHSDHQGKGFACESCKAALEQLSRLHPAAGFTAGTALDNAPSLALLRKLGFQLTGTEKLSFRKDEEGNDIFFEGGKFSLPAANLREQIGAFSMEERTMNITSSAKPAQDHRITPAAMEDLEAVRKYDRHIPEARLAECIRRGQVLVLRSPDTVVGVLRWSLFWQTIPFLDLIYIDKACRHRGHGRRMMAHWEALMAEYPHVMLSTQEDETAKYFYEKLGYRRIGSFSPPGQEAEEILYLKERH